jgi:hypothetical protein
MAGGPTRERILPDLRGWFRRVRRTSPARYALHVSVADLEIMDLTD